MTSYPDTFRENLWFKYLGTFFVIFRESESDVLDRYCEERPLKIPFRSLIWGGHCFLFRHYVSTPSSSVFVVSAVSRFIGSSSIRTLSTSLTSQSFTPCRWDSLLTRSLRALPYSSMDIQGSPRSVKHPLVLSGKTKGLTELYAWQESRFRKTLSSKPQNVLSRDMELLSFLMFYFVVVAVGKLSEKWKLTSLLCMCSGDHPADSKE